MYRSFLPRMRHVADKIYGVIQNTHFIINAFFFFRKVARYVTARQATDDNIIWRMCFVCRITKAIDMY